MVKSSPKDVVDAYLNAFGEKKFDKAGEYLSKTKFSFIGPIDRFDNVNSFLNAIKKLEPILEKIEMRKIFVDGSDVCAIYDMLTSSPAGTVRCTELCHVNNDGKITSTEVFFDASPFRAMFEKEHQK